MEKAVSGEIGMIDREKVIKGLECCTARNGTCQYKQEPICPYVKHCQKEDYAALQRDALALLKEQEPLEPIRVTIDQAGPLYHRCYCKKCGHHVGNMIKNKVTEAHENFCSKCGQAVKWE